MAAESDDWERYLAGFHHERAGITEAVLRASIDGAGPNPYDWLLEAVPAEGFVVDVACGSAPLWTPTLAGRYLGVDPSDKELELAADRGAYSLTRGTAADIPVQDGQAGVVVCSMALMILPALADVLREIRRILSADGILVAMIPTGPTTARDLPVLSGMVAALGRTPWYPNDRRLRKPGDLFADNGLRLVSDERRRFAYRLSDRHAADRMADSLYLPGVPDRQQRRLRTFLRGSVRVNAVMPVPIRRFVARPLP